MLALFQSSAPVLSRVKAEVKPNLVSGGEATEVPQSEKLNAMLTAKGWGGVCGDRRGVINLPNGTDVYYAESLEALKGYKVAQNDATVGIVRSGSRVRYYFPLDGRWIETHNAHPSRDAEGEEDSQQQPNQTHNFKVGDAVYAIRDFAEACYMFYEDDIYEVVSVYGDGKHLGAEGTPKPDYVCIDYDGECYWVPSKHLALDAPAD